jgi:hypothetical protein
LVKEAALRSIAQRDDPSLLPNIAAALEDEKDVVRFTQALERPADDQKLSEALVLSEMASKDSP